MHSESSQVRCDGRKMTVNLRRRLFDRAKENIRNMTFFKYLCTERANITCLLSSEGAKTWVSDAFLRWTIPSLNDIARWSAESVRRLLPNLITEFQKLACLATCLDGKLPAIFG